MGLLLVRRKFRPLAFAGDDVDAHLALLGGGREGVEQRDVRQRRQREVDGRLGLGEGQGPGVQPGGPLREHARAFSGVGRGGGVPQPDVADHAVGVAEGLRGAGEREDAHGVSSQSRRS